MLRKERADSLDRFKIFETNQFLRDLEQDFSGQKERIKTKLTTYVYPQLRQNPYFGKNIKKLLNYKPDTWRYRIGSYRFFYEIDDQKKIVFLIAADNRQSAY
jgi:mRNA interferase RelE/StbE